MEKEKKFLIPEAEIFIFQDIDTITISDLGDELNEDDTPTLP